MSEVADHFRKRVHASLEAEQRESLVAAAGTGPTRELPRALLLSDRAVRVWATRAAVHEQSGRLSAYERLAPLTPELGRAVKEAAVAEQETGLDAERALIAEMVWGIGERLVGIDTEASLASSQHSLNHMASRRLKSSSRPDVCSPIPAGCAARQTKCCGTWCGLSDALPPPVGDQASVGTAATVIALVTLVTIV
jgi:hypothetical protein